MNRNKKTFTPNMRVAALYLLMGVLLLLAVTLFSGRESMRATEEYFDRTINFVKVQSTSYEKYNDTITAKSLRRMAVSVRQLAENDTLDLYDPESLRAETESLWLTGIAVLDENGESLCEYTDGNIDYAQFAESLREQAALNVLQNPQKTYLKRILLQDGTAVDVATRRAAAGDAVLLAYRVTPPEFVEGTALSIQSVLDGYPKNISGTIFIVQDNKVIAANDPSLIGLYTTNSPLVQGIRKAGAPDILTHTRDWANSGCYFGMYSNGQNFDLYLYIDEKSVFRNFSSALLTALIFYLICVAVLQTLRRRSMKLAEQQKREQEQKYHAQLEEQNRKLELAVRHEAAANRAKREFLFNMSHDIRTPMNAIIGFTSLAATHIENKEQVLDYLKKISTSSQHLLSLINDVLDMSRIESGKVKIEEKAVHLPDLVHDVRSIIQPNISSKRLSLFIDKGCIACHAGANFGGQAYFPFGVVERPGADVLPPTDKGRFTVTQTASDEYVFRAAPLRNIALTAPYFHSGQVWDLEQAVAIMGNAQLGHELDAGEVQAITRFLRTLTGTQPRIQHPVLPTSTLDTPRPE